MTFTITSFFVAQPLGGGSTYTYTLLVTQAGDTITGTFGMSGPLNGELSPNDVGEMGLFLQTSPGDRDAFDAVDSNGGNTSYIGNAVSGTLQAYGIGTAQASDAVILSIQPDNTADNQTSPYLVRVSLTVSNPNRTTPPPLISAQAKQALNVVTGQLDALSRGFDMLNSANPYAAGLKTANWGASLAVDRLSPQIGFANSVQQTVLSVEDTAAAAGEGNPVAVVLGMVSTIYAITGVVTGALAADPPDGNFTSVFQPANDSFTVAGATTADDALMKDSIAFLDDTLSMLVASERFQGATLAGDTAGETLQTNAYDTAQAASLADSAAVSADLSAFQSELVSDGYSDESYGGGSLAAVRSEIATAGTSDPFLANLIDDSTFLLGGTTAAGTLAQSVISDIGSETVTAVSGTVFGGLGAAAADLTSYANGTLQCFLRGTLIRSASGEIPVERLVPGDSVVVEGGEDSQVTWIGHRRLNAARHPNPRAVWPVRIAAGTFGQGRPYRDLFLSPDHAVFVAGVLVPVKHLIDGRAIAVAPREEAEWYHVELSRHEVIFANGLAAESYLDTGDRWDFDNNDPVVRLFALLSAPRDAVGTKWEAAGRAPLVVSGKKLAAIRAWLEGRRERVSPDGER